MRRALRDDLPTLAFLYGLSWEDIVEMPPPELNRYLAQANKFLQIAASRGG